MVDTLIVGGGTAGCVLAARLSEDPDHSVRLVEAGPVSIDAAQLLDATRMPIGPESTLVWRYPVDLADDVAGNIVRGRVIGGSGAINGGYFVRATAADFTAWSKELGGSASWSFDAVLPAYRRLERDLDYGDRPGHGTTGPIPVRRTAAPTPLSREFASVCAALGLAAIPDLNALPGAGPAEGWGPVPCNIEHGRRVDTGTAYLAPALDRPNLTVTGAMLVTRIRFHGTRAVGVDYLHDGRAGTLAADRIVLCAGAIESAALLLRSGIGDPGQLRALDVPVLHPAPVGAWFSDHPEIGIDYRGDPALASGVGIPLEYVLELDDVEIRPYTVSFTPYIHRLGVALMRPRSEGVLRLRSTDPTIAPLIDFRYLSADADRIRLREAVTMAVEVLHGIPMVRAPESKPEPADAWLRANLATSQHLSGTCRMGGADDERAVVDERCRVHGTTGLSVVDLSVVPVPLSRGPKATTVMIAERISEYLT
ncbi:mycofactocin system GMC family oxidoreductase MftG [Nocardia sp. NPDC005998]|uniref:mycofactocin dehydrogenase MftG n=1 Tax=Nocardia sp. NPDC005998 TaxID=3156894 RepID=UPI0033BEDE86